MFVGEERRRIVEDLSGAFDGVVASGEPQLWSLVAPSGAGKSRIVQELYAWLAAERQPEKAGQRYWPACIATLGDGRSPLVNRKRTHPHESDGGLVVPAGLTIPWMWWGLNCVRSTDGGYGQILFDDDTQLRQHVGIASGEDRESRLHERLEAGGALASLIIAVVAIGGVILSGVLAVLAVVQLLFRRRARLFRVFEGRIARVRGHLGPVRDRRIDVERAGRQREVDGLAGAIVRKSERTPFVIFIEDAHDADDGLVSLVEHILSSGRARVLIVTTMHPQAGRALRPMEELARRAQEVDVLSRRSHEVRLAPLSDEDLGQVVVELHQAGSIRCDRPNVATINRIVARYGSTVLFVHQLFATDYVTRVLQERPLGLEDLEGIPTDIASLIHMSLAVLDRGLKLVLVCAAHAGMRFVSEPIIAEARRFLPEEDVQGYLQDAVELHGLLRQRGNGTFVFVDQAIRDVARTLAVDHLGPADIRSLYGRLAEHSLELAGCRDVLPGADTSWTIHHTLVREGHVEGAAAVPALTRLAQLLASRSATREAIDVLGTAIDYGSESLQLDLRTLRVHWLLELSHGRAALDQSDELMAGDVEHGHRLVLELLRVRALQECADLPRALADLESLLPRILATFSDESAPVLAAKNLEAVLLLRTGRADDARARFAAIVDARTRSTGASSRSTLATRTLEARAAGESGSTEDAVQLFTALVAELRRTLGSVAPETFNARANLVRFLAESGDATSARTEGQALLAECKREIGDDHPRTLARWNLLVLVSELSGDHVEAVNGFRQVLARKEQVLGIDHPHTHITRMDLARNLLGADMIEEALAELEPLAAWAVRTLGTLDPLRLAAEGTRRLALARTGRASPGDIAALHELVEKSTHGLGALAIPTVLLRNHLAQAIGAHGDPLGAVEVLGRLASEVEERLGPTHRHTLAVRSNLARWTAQSDPVVAADLFRALEVDLETTLGAAHPFTLSVARSLTGLARA